MFIDFNVSRIDKYAINSLIDFVSLTILVNNICENSDLVCRLGTRNNLT